MVNLKKGLHSLSERVRSMSMTLSSFAEALRAACAQENAQFCIVYHINPDGDCIGSAFALALILRALGAKTAVEGRDSVPAQFRVLTDVVPQDTLTDDAQYIGVDCKDRSRTGSGYCEQPYRFWIDHHGSPVQQVEYEYVRPECSACSELVLEVAEALGVQVTVQIAELLFTAIITDTSRFCTVSTNAGTFETAAKLTRYGANAFGIARRFDKIKSKECIAAEQIIFAGMHYLCEGRLVTGMLTIADLAAAGIAGQNDPALQSINSLPEVVGTAVVTVMIREYPAGNPEGRTRFSIKSTVRTVSARDIAERLGGGGHPHAAGGFLSDDPETARQGRTGVRGGTRMRYRFAMNYNGTPPQTLPKGH